MAASPSAPYTANPDITRHQSNTFPAAERRSADTRTGGSVAEGFMAVGARQAAERTARAVRCGPAGWPSTLHGGFIGV